jgi:hypothetical protein
MRRSTLFSVVVALLVTGACADVPEDARVGVTAPNGSERAFGPVADFLGHRCGTLDCHGTPERSLRIWSCEGMRLEPIDVSICSRAKGGRRTTPAEHQATYRSVVGLEPTVMSVVVASRGAELELLTLMRKARGFDAHKGGALIVPGDDQDVCLTSWLSGRTNLRACGNAFAEPVFAPPSVPPPAGPAPTP